MRILAALIAFGLLTGPAASEPLRMIDNPALFQRIIVQKTSPMRQRPDGRGEGRIEALTPLYVFERRETDRAIWLRVSANERGFDDFWLRDEETLPWRQNIVLTFERHGDLERLLFMETIDDVFDLIESDAPGADAATLRRAAASAERNGGSAAPVVGLGPRRSVDLSRNFYFMPILDQEVGLFETNDGGFVNVLNVAVAKGEGDSGGGGQSGLEDLRLGVVFVIDTTRSMGRYITRTNAAVMEMYDRLSRSKVGSQISFGLIGHQDSREAAPKLDYLTEVFVPVADQLDRRSFAREMAKMTEARASSKHFREDSLAGVDKAIAELRNADLDAGWVILITDASSRDANDRFSSTRRSPKGISNYANESNIYIATLHLKTPASASDHGRAESRYKDLSRVRNEGSMYWGIENGDEAAFEAAAIDIATVLADDLAEAAYGEGLPESQGLAQSDDRLAKVKRVAKAIRLKYLGSKENDFAPDVFSAWIADLDYEKRRLKPVEIRLLLTKNQLSDLEDGLRRIADEGYGRSLDPKQFFRQIVAASADMSRRPDQVASRPDTLADAALITGYLKDLPYKSEVMNVTEGDWLEWNAAKQTEFLDGLAERAERYRTLNASPELWVTITRAGRSEEVYPMLLDDLP